MPKLTVPDQPDLGDAGTPVSIAGDTSGVKIGQIGMQAADMMAEQGNRIGNITGQQGADAVAQTAKIGDIYAQGAQEAAKTYADIGQTEQNAGQAVMALGNKYFEEAEGAIQDGIYNNAYAGASKELAQRVQDRINTPYDKNGNPTFSTLSTDISNITADVQSKFGGSLGNPEVANRFNSAISQLGTSYAVSGMKEGRDQQIQYSTGSLTNNLNTTTINAMSASPEQVAGLIAQGNTAIDSAVKNGYITSEAGVQQKEKLKNDISMGRVSISAQKDPVATAMRLNNPQDPEFSQLNPVQRAKAIDENTRRLSELSRQNTQQANEAKANQQQFWNFNKENAELGIANGTYTATDANNDYNAGKISHGQMADLTLKSNATQGITAKKTITRNAIGTSMQQGEVLQGKYSDSDINDMYQYTQKLAGVPMSLFDPKSPTDQTRIVSQIKAPVTDYQKQLQGVIASGSPQDVVQAVSSFKFVADKNPIALQGLDPKTRAALYSIDSQMMYANVDPGTAVANARQNIMQQDPSVQETRNKAFDNEDLFKPANITATIHSIYDTSSLGSVFSGKQSGTLDSNDTAIIQGLLKQNYSYLGDAKQAVELTKQQTNGIWGATSINPQTGSDKPIMFMPPEYAYPQYNFDVNGKPAMRVNLENDIAPVLAASKNSGWAPHQADIPVSSISIEPNRYAPSRQLGQTSYQVFGTLNGHKVPIVDPKSGQPLTWTPSDGFIKNLKQQQYDSGVQNSLTIQKQGARSGTNLMGDSPVQVQPAHDDQIRSQFGLPPLQPTQTNPDGTVKPGVNNTTAMSLGVGTRQNVINSALGYLGYNEVAHRQVLGNMISQMVGSSTDPASTPWCAGFVNAILKMNGVQGSGSLAAQSLLKVGTPTNNPQKGDIVVFDRGNGLGHTGFYMGTNADGSINVLSGNQGNMVSIKAFGIAHVLGYRSLPSGDDAKAIMTGSNVPSSQQGGTNTATPTTDYMTPTGPAAMHPVGQPNNPHNDPYGGDILGMAQMDNKALPIGIRQNNPGNVVKNGNQWDGELPNASSRFKEFATPEDGIAAIARTVSQYNNKYQINTVAGIIHRYSATDQGEYTRNVATALNVDPNEHLDVNNMDTMTKIVKAIIKQENGYIPYDDRTIAAGIVRNKYMAQPITTTDNSIASKHGWPNPKDLHSDTNINVNLGL